DTAQISYVLGAAAQVTVALTDATGATLANLFAGPQTQGIHTFAWREIGVPDGQYRLTISAQGASGKQVSTTTAFYVDRTLGHVRAAPAAISPNGDGRFDTATLSLQLAAPAALRVELWRAGKRLATLVDGPLPVGPFETTWNGRIGAKRAPDGAYQLITSATDTLTTVTASTPVTVDTTPPRLRLVSRARLQFWIGE